MAAIDSKKLADKFNLDSLEESTSVAATSSGDFDPGDAPSSVNMEQVFAELTKLIKNGNDILENVKYIIRDNPDDGELVAAASALISSIRDTLREFTAVYKMTLKHSHNLDLEKLKMSGRRELLETKIRETKEMLRLRNNGMFNGKQPSGLADGAEDMIPFCQEDIIKMITDNEKKPVSGTVLTETPSGQYIK